MTDTTAGIRATRNSVAVLETVADRDGITLQAIAEETGFSLSTVHDHLTTLQELGFVVKDDGLYRPGLRSLEFGGIARRRFREYFRSRDEMSSLADRFDGLVQVAVREGSQCVYLYQYGQQPGDLADLHVGMRIDLHSSGAGKAILADLPADRLDAYLETSSLSRHTAATITDVDDLRSELAAGRESELTYDYGEHFEDVNCVATPLDVDAPVPAALSLALPSDEYDRSTLESTVADEVHNIGRVIEMKRKYDDLE